MKEDTGAKENSNAEGRGFGLLRSMSNIFGGNNTSNNSFFKPTFSNLFGSESPSSTRPDNLQHESKSKGPIIEELDDDAAGMSEKNQNDTDAARSNRNPIVELPEDQEKDDAECKRNSRDLMYTEKRNKEQKHTRSISSFKRVSYGGINGTYYTATTSSVTRNGVTLEETKQADRSTGKATHKISKGIDGKGHSVVRRLNSDGKVDTTQILHNLNEDEFLGFEKAWKTHADWHLQDWNGKLDFPWNIGNTGKNDGQVAAWGGFSDPFSPHFNRGASFHHNLLAQSSQGRSKKVVTINIE